jgi:hypothetical protein
LRETQQSSVLASLTDVCLGLGSPLFDGEPYD